MITNLNKENPLESIVVEWSRSQQCFHRHPLKRMIEGNNRSFSTGVHTDYMPIGIFSDSKEADKALKVYHKFKDDGIENNSE